MSYPSILADGRGGLIATMAVTEVPAGPCMGVALVQVSLFCADTAALKVKSQTDRRE
jgi:hypothetical protein